MKLSFVHIDNNGVLAKDMYYMKPQCCDTSICTKSYYAALS